MSNPDRSPAGAARIAGIVAALLCAAGGAEAGRISDIAPAPSTVQPEDSETDVYHVEPPEEFRPSEPGNDIHSLLGRIDGAEMQQYAVSGKPENYRLPMSGGRGIQVGLENGKAALSLRVLSLPDAKAPGPMVIHSSSTVHFRAMEMERPRLHVANGIKYVHLNIVDEAAGRHVRVMVPKDFPDGERDLVVMLFSLEATHREILSGLSKLPRIAGDSSKENAIANSVIEKAQERMIEEMPSPPASDTDPRSLKPVGRLLDDVIEAYGIGLNCMVDVLEQETKGMTSAERERFLLRVLPYAVGVLLRPYHVSYSGLRSLAELDELLADPKLDHVKLKRFARENDLVPEYNAILKSFLE